MLKGEAPSCFEDGDQTSFFGEGTVAVFENALIPRIHQFLTTAVIARRACHLLVNSQL
jgi:hypothetical protein